MRNYLAAQAQLHGRPVDRRGCTRPRRAHRRQRLPAGPRRRNRSRQHASAGRHLEVSLDQAVANHQAGTAPLLDELRARVDYQSLRAAVDRGPELSGERQAGPGPHHRPAPRAELQSFRQSALRGLRSNRRGRRHSPAHANRKDLAAMVEQTKAAEHQRKAATADRLPTFSFNGDYGDIGVNLANSHGTGDATGTIASRCSRSSLCAAKRRRAGAARHRAGPVERQERAGRRRCSRRAARYSISAQKQVEVAQSSVDARQ